MLKLQEETANPINSESPNIYIQSSKQRLVFCITWLPCSWTTILAKVIDAYTNSFMLYQPMQTYLTAQKEAYVWNSENPIQFLDKTVHWHIKKLIWMIEKQQYDCKTPTWLHLTEPEKLLNAINQFLESPDNEYTIWWVKEVFKTTRPSIYKQLLQTNQSDIILVNIRNPLHNFNSWKRKQRGGRIKDVSFFIENFLALYDQLDPEKHTLISHEKFATHWIPYLNQRLPWKVILESLLQLNPIDEESVSWNKTALQSTKILAPEEAIEQLTKEDIRSIETKVMPFYHQLLASNHI